MTVVKFKNILTASAMMQRPQGLASVYYIHVAILHIHIFIHIHTNLPLTLHVRYFLKINKHEFSPGRSVLCVSKACRHRKVTEIPV